MSPFSPELRDLRATLQLIENGFTETAAVVALGERVLALRAERVSAWSVAEQVDHLIKVEQSILSHLLTRNPAPGPRITLAGRFVLLTGWIPRGSGTSPKRLRGLPAGQAELTAALDACRKTLRTLAADPEPLLGPAAVLPHKMFGALTAVEALRFVPIHTRHHLLIVTDIRKSAVAR